MVWSDMLNIQIPVLEKVLRTVLVYGGLAVLLRLAGKRDLAQLNTFDLVVMLLLSNVVQNAVIGNDNSLAGGLLGAVVLVSINAVWVRVANRAPRLTKILEGTPTVLVENGKIVANLERLGLRRADIAAVLRHQGAADIGEVQEATLEPGGTIVVNLRKEDQDATVKDLTESHARLVAELRAEIARLTERVDSGFATLRTGKDPRTGETGTNNA